MKKYLAFFRMKFLNGLQYRTAAYAGIATQFAWGFMEILLFAAFYRADPKVFPMPFPQLSSYIWLQQAFLALYMIWFLDDDIFEFIKNGAVAYELCRPMDLYHMWFVKNMAERIARAVLRCLPILIVAVFLPKPFNMGAPLGVTDFALFLLSLGLAFLLVVAFCMLIYIAVFYTLSPVGIRVIVISLTDLLTGSIVPIPFFPEKIRRIAELLPFAYMQNIPLRIYGGNISGREALIDTGLQAVWLAVFLLGGRVWMKQALKRVVVQGG